MAELTTPQKEQFTAEQLPYANKLAARQPDRWVADAIAAKWARKSPDQLRARACLDHISWGSDATITWSSDCDLTDEQKASIRDLLTSGRKFEDVATEVLGGRKSLEQRVSALGGRGQEHKACTAAARVDRPVIRLRTGRGSKGRSPPKADVGGVPHGSPRGWVGVRPGIGSRWEMDRVYEELTADEVLRTCETDGKAPAA